MHATGVTPEQSHERSPWRVFVREERETKTAASRQRDQKSEISGQTTV